LVSAKVIEKILGSSADYIGGGVQNWTNQRVKNVGTIFENAERIFADKIDTPGTVPPKVLKGILDDSSFCDDELGAEYFGGVLRRRELKWGAMTAAQVCWALFSPGVGSDWRQGARHWQG